MNSTLVQKSILAEIYLILYPSLGNITTHIDEVEVPKEIDNRKLKGYLIFLRTKKLTSSIKIVARVCILKFRGHFNPR